MTTQKIYYRDPYLHTFCAQVVAVKPGWLALDQTAFYPEGGGQPADHGWLQDRRVTDVQIDEKGVIWHQVDLESEVGAKVEGRLDWLRRFDHMQQHTAQHVLSQAFCQLYAAETVGFHLGEQIVTIDLAVSEREIDAMALTYAEALANAKLRSKLPVRSYEVSAEMLKPALLRKLPQVEKHIRLVEIGDFDLCPCCGTHVCDLGEVGLIKVLDSEKKRGNLRIFFVAGQRAYKDYSNKHEQLRALSTLLSEPITGVVDAVERLQMRLKELERERKSLRRQFLILQAKEFLVHAQDWGEARSIVRELPNSTLDEAKFLASYLAEQGAYVVLLGIPGAPYRLVAAVSSQLKITIGPLLQRVVAKHGGRGGGSATAAQGAVSASAGETVLEQLAALCRQALS